MKTEKQNEIEFDQAQEPALVTFYGSKFKAIVDELEIWKTRLQQVIDEFFSLGEGYTLTYQEFQSMFKDGHLDKPHEKNISDLIWSQATKGMKLSIQGVKIKREMLDIDLPDPYNLTELIENLPFFVVKWHGFENYEFDGKTLEISPKALENKKRECSLFANNALEYSRYKHAKQIVDALNNCWAEFGLNPAYREHYIDGCLISFYDNKFVCAKFFIKTGIVSDRPMVPGTRLNSKTEKTSDIRNTNTTPEPAKGSKESAGGIVAAGFEWGNIQ